MRPTTKALERRSELPPLVAVVGPTASGKSELGIELAEAFDGEIVSADSRQVYRGLDIGTGKVTPEERARVPHHLLDVVSPMQPFTLADYQRLAFAAIDDIHARGRLPLLVGGTGLYVRAVIDNLRIPRVPPDPALRAELAGRSREELADLLRELDPDAASWVDLNNPRRVIRAIEVARAAGSFRAARGVGPPRYRALQLGLTWPPAALRARIEARLEARLAAGLIEEVAALLAAGVSARWLEDLGLEYRFVTRYLEGRIADRAELARQLGNAIWQYARRQLTWFRKDGRIVWLDVAGDYRAEAHRRVEAWLG